MCKSKNTNLDSTSKIEPIVLVVGEVARSQLSGQSLPAASTLIFAEFHEISAALLEELKPDIVLSPLLCPTFDCLDLAQVLESFNFDRRYRVMVPTLPDPRVILAEVRMLCPSIDFSFIFTNDAVFPGRS